MSEDKKRIKNYDLYEEIFNRHLSAHRHRN